MILKINDDYYPIQHSQTRLSNGNTIIYLLGTT